MKEENLILQEIQKLNNKIDNLEAGLNKVSVELNEKIDRVSVELNEKIDRVSTELNSRIDHLETSTIPEMQQDIRNISQTVARIEVEHGKKLEALFDAFSMHSEKIKSNEENIKECMRRLEKQESEIYYLSQKFNS